MTSPLSNWKDEPDRELAQIIDKLSQRFPHLPEQWLHDLVRDVHGRFRDVPVRAFVPVLVEHQVIGTIRQASAAVSVADGAPSAPLRALDPYEPDAFPREGQPEPGGLRAVPGTGRGVQLD